MACTPLQTAVISKFIDNSVEAKLEQAAADFTGWTATAEVYKLHGGGRAGDSLFTPAISLKENITGKISYSVEITAAQTDTLDHQDAVLVVVFTNDLGNPDDTIIRKLETCLTHE